MYAVNVRIEKIILSALPAKKRNPQADLQKTNILVVNTIRKYIFFEKSLFSHGVFLQGSQYCVW